MNIPFLRYLNFKKGKGAEGSAVAVAPPPIEKPASERFGKTVMPNVSRIVGPDSQARFPTGGLGTAVAGVSGISPAGPRRISLGGNGGIAVAGADSGAGAGERTIALQLADLVEHLPAGLLKTAPIDPEQRVLFKASEVERGMASGRPTVLLRSVFQQVPDLFVGDVEVSDERVVALPLAKVLEQFATFQVRPDQLAQAAVPQVETPFLKVTLEDRERFGEKAAPIPAPAAAAPGVPTAIESKAPAAAEPGPLATPDRAADAPGSVARRPIRLASPNGAGTSPATPAAPESILLPTATGPAPIAPKKISPNGTGVPSTERVPASSGPPVPTPLPSALAPQAPIRIPFKISPPSNDLRDPSSPVTTPPLPKPATAEFSHDGPQVRLPLRNVLRGISPFQLTGPVDAVPDSAMVEIPFSVVEPQLALGRIAVAPAQFQAALPEEFRGLFKADEADAPVILPLQEVLQNLPAEKLQLRDDQTEVVLTETFETPFSAKAAEDAARMNVSKGPIAKSGAAAGRGDPGDAKRKKIKAENLEHPASTPADEMAAELPESRGPAKTVRTRTALQVAFDTDEELDAKAVVTHVNRLPGVSACAIAFSDGLSLAGNIPAEYQAEALCALAPSIMKRINDQMVGASLGPLTGITLYCAKTPVSLFAHGNICLAALHAAGEITPEVRARLGCAVRDLARMYAQPA